MAEIKPIKVTREFVSDDAVMVIDLPVSNGSRVKQGQLVAMVETSKASIEILSPGDGYLFFRVSIGDQLPVGSDIAYLSNNEHFTFPAASAASKTPDAGLPPNTRFSKPAQRLIEQYRLDPSIFSDLSMVRESDVVARLPKGSVEELIVQPMDESSLRGKSILVFGAGGHAAMCIDILRQMNRFPIAGLIVDTLNVGQEVMGLKVLGKTADLPKLRAEQTDLIVNGLGAVEKHSLRKDFFLRFKSLGFTLPNLVHPRAAIEPSAIMGEGNQIMANATVGSLVRIGNNCIVNSNAVVSHGSTLHDHVHVTPGALLAGNVRIGQGSVIGMGSTVYLRVAVGENVLIHNGCDVTRDVPDGTIVTARHSNNS